MASSLAHKLPVPQDIDAEAAVLGALTLNSDVLSPVVSILGESPEVFYSPAHRHIYSAMLKLSRDNKPIDMRLLCEQLTRDSTLEEAGGVSYTSSLSDVVPTSSHAEYYAEIVREAYVKRWCIQVCTKAVTELYKSDCDIEAVVSGVETELFNITKGNVGGTCAPITDFLDDERAKLQHLLDGGELTGLRTGIASLDQILRPLGPGDYVVVAARPSIGKTTFVSNIAFNIMKRSAAPVLFISLEMSASSITKKFISIAGGVNVRAIETKRCIDRVAAQGLERGVKILEVMPLYIDDEGGITGMQLRAKIKAAVKNHRIELVILDYIGLMSDPSTETQNIRVSNISRHIKTAAKESRVPIIALSQFSREADKGDGAKMSHLRDSGAIEQDADFIIALSKKISEDNQELVYCDIQKQREGETGSVDLLFNKAIQKFTCLSFEPEPVEDDGYAGHLIEDIYEEDYTPF